MENVPVINPVVVREVVAYMQREGISQREMAECAGISQPHLSRLLKGGTKATPEVWELLYNAIQGSVVVPVPDRDIALYPPQFNPYALTFYQDCVAFATVLSNGESNPNRCLDLLSRKQTLLVQTRDRGRVQDKEVMQVVASYTFLFLRKLVHCRKAGVDLAKLDAHVDTLRMGDSLKDIPPVDMVLSLCVVATEGTFKPEVMDAMQGCASIITQIKDLSLVYEKRQYLLYLIKIFAFMCVQFGSITQMWDMVGRAFVDLCKACA